MKQLDQDKLCKKCAGSNRLILETFNRSLQMWEFYRNGAKEEWTNTEIKKHK